LHGTDAQNLSSSTQKIARGGKVAELSSNIEWKRWGRVDPFWSIINWKDKQKNGRSPWTPEEIYALGASDWRDFERHWSQYGYDARSCLEIGCGAGRITKHLARTFDHVYGVDVSEHMIELASRALDSGNVELFVTDGIHVPLQDELVRSIFSVHVIQHVDSTDIGYLYFREFYRLLAPGGTLMIHLPLHHFPNDSRVDKLMRSTYYVFRRLSDLQADLRRKFGAPLMRWTSWPIQELTRVLTRLGFRDIEFRIASVRSNGAPYSFVFAKKPA
jgi:ubiquinone/menaquinone biosynthesis C-methylase UbiE